MWKRYIDNVFFFVFDTELISIFVINGFFILTFKYLICRKNIIYLNSKIKF